MSETLPAASVERNDTVPLALNTIPSAYIVHAPPFREYSFRTESSAKLAVTVTSRLVAAMMSAATVGASGGRSTICNIKLS